MTQRTDACACRINRVLHAWRQFADSERMAIKEIGARPVQFTIALHLALHLSDASLVKPNARHVFEACPRCAQHCTQIFKRISRLLIRRLPTLSQRTG